MVTAMKIARLDRRLRRSSPGVSALHDGASNTTTWTIPFNVAVDGSEGTLAVVSATPSAAATGPAYVMYTSTRPAANQIAVQGQGDLSAADVYIGVLYTFKYKLSTIFKRNFFEGESVDARGRTQVLRIALHFQETNRFAVVVTAKDRAPLSYLFQKPALGSTGTFSVPVKSKNEQVDIEIIDTSPGDCRFAGFDWEGTHEPQARRS